MGDTSFLRKSTYRCWEKHMEIPESKCYNPIWNQNKIICFHILLWYLIWYIADRKKLYAAYLKNAAERSKYGSAKNTHRFRR